MIDYAALLYGPLYDVFGVDAVLTVACGDPPMNISVIDKTAGVSVAFNGVAVETVSPAAVVRAAELASVDMAKLCGAKLTFNGNTWTVVNHAAQPSPAGEADGEILLMLSEE